MKAKRMYLSQEEADYITYLRSIGSRRKRTCGHCGSDRYQMFINNAVNPAIHWVTCHQCGWSTPPDQYQDVVPFDAQNRRALDAFSRPVDNEEVPQ